jgi:hypothetical protein
MWLRKIKEEGRMIRCKLKQCVITLRKWYTKIRSSPTANLFSTNVSHEMRMHIWRRSWERKVVFWVIESAGTFKYLVKYTNWTIKYSNWDFNFKNVQNGHSSPQAFGTRHGMWCKHFLLCKEDASTREYEKSVSTLLTCNHSEFKLC